MTLHTVTDPRTGKAVVVQASSVRNAAHEGMAELLFRYGVVTPSLRVSRVGSRKSVEIPTVGHPHRGRYSLTNPRSTKGNNMPRRNPRRRTPISKKCAIPKGRKHGDTFTRGGRKFQVISYMRDGKRIRYARRV